MPNDSPQPPTRKNRWVNPLGDPTSLDLDRLREFRFWNQGTTDVRGFLD